MDLLERFISEKIGEFKREGVRVVVSGEIDGLPSSVERAVTHAIEETAHNDGLILNIALNYGARQEIAQACRKIARAAVAGRIDPERIDVDTVSRFLYTAQIPDPDLVIRTSGEMRLSNFLLWQSAYTELYFTATLWPDFTPAELLRAIAAYQERERRFGIVKDGDG
jgi:undecaprenyl diphosphate synthase